MSTQSRRRRICIATTLLVMTVPLPVLAHDFGRAEIIGSDGCCYRWNYHWHSDPDDYVPWPATVNYALWISSVSVDSSFAEWLRFGDYSGAVASGDAYPLINNKWYQMKLRYALPFIPKITRWFGKVFVARTVCGSGALP